MTAFQHPGGVLDAVVPMAAPRFPFAVVRRWPPAASPCLVRVLVGHVGVGKSSWAGTSPRTRSCRATGSGRSSVRARRIGAFSDGAFGPARPDRRAPAARRLTTVVDTLGLDPDRRAAWLASARSTAWRPRRSCSRRPLSECRAPQPSSASGPRRRALAAGPAGGRASRTSTTRASPRCSTRSWCGRPPAVAHAATTSRASPVGLRFGLQIPVWSWPGGNRLRPRLTAIAGAAEEAGFGSIWVMDHFRQIPMFGPPGRTCSRAGRRSPSWPA